MKNQPSPLRLATTMLGACAAAASINLLTPRGAPAETIYRCGPDLKQYSQMPCDGGHSFEVDDRRNADQLLQAQSAAETQSKAARELERTRHDFDRNRPTYGSLSPRPETVPSTRQPKTGKRKTGKPGAQAKKSGRAHPVDGAEFTAVNQPPPGKKPSTKAGKPS